MHHYFQFAFNKNVQLLSRIVLGGIFIYAGGIKIYGDVNSMKSILQSYDLLPQELITFVAIILPWIELVSGLFLLFNIFPRYSAQILCILLVMFIIAISINIIRGHDHACGCFSSSTALANSYWLILRNGFLLLLGIFIALYEKNKNTAQQDKSI